jgi:MSHA biogenesis protein MshQ
MPFSLSFLDLVAGVLCRPGLIGLWVALGVAIPAHAALYAEYRFEESAYNGTANEVRDTSGNGRHARIVGAASSSSSGYSGRGLLIPDDGGSSASNALDTGIDINSLGTSGSITFWFKRTSTDNLWKMLLDATTSSSARFYLSREGDTATLNDIGASLTMGGLARDALSLNHIYGSQWTYVALTWADGSGYKFYTRDSACAMVAQDSTSGSGALSTSVGTLYVGDNRTSATGALIYADNSSANGTFDTVRIYNHQLSATETASDCTSVAGLDHLEVTSSSASGASGGSVTYTIKACANASCSALYTNGVTGTLAVVGAGVTTTYTTGAAFAIANGSSSTTETVSLAGSGLATVSLASVLPATANSTPVFCGLGAAASSGGSCVFTVILPLHHLELTAASSTTLTCQPVTYTIKACADGASPCTAYVGTSPITGQLSVSGTTVTYPSGSAFTIAAGASSTMLSAHATTTGTATATLTGLSVTPTNTPAIFCGMGATAASGNGCGISVASSALQVSVPAHRAGVSQASATIKAVRSSDNAQLCLAAFSGTKTINLQCAHVNPGAGTSTMPLLVNGVALNAANNASARCDGTGANLSLSFDSAGVATLSSLQYKDVGLMSLTASYTGSGSDAGLSMSGSSTFVVAPYDMAVTGLAPNASPSSTGCATSIFMAGCAFRGTVTARNAQGAATPNFGRESSPEGVTLSFTRTMPASGSNGVFSGSVGSFAGGAASSTNLIWSEVGKGDVAATLTSGSYLGSGLSASGSSTGGSAGIFHPHHFLVGITPGCGSFTYSGQPFGVSVLAVNAAGATTTNYAGSGTISASSPVYPNGVTLTETSGVAGALVNGGVAASSFVNGLASVGASSTSPRFTFAQKLTASGALSLRATDSYPASGAANSSGYDGTLSLRSGRLKLSNAFGSERSALTVSAQLQYWNGKAWVLNSADTCTTSIPASAVALSGHVDEQGSATSAWSTVPSAMTFSGGNGGLTLSAPSPSGATGSVDLAVNLGSTGTDQSCLSSHPATTGANMAYLRSNNGSCASSFDRDPSARVTFGVFSPETRKLIHIRELH